MKTELSSHTLYLASGGNAITKLLCHDSGVLVGEERDPERKRTSFFCIDLIQAKTLWSGVELQENWWLSLAELTVDALYIQVYKEGPLPTPSGVSALALSTGDLRWSVPGVSYFAELAEEVILLQQGMLQEQYLAVDRLTGELTRKLGREELPQRRDSHTHLGFPSILDAQELASSHVETLLKTQIDTTDLRGSIEHFLHKDLTILSCYRRDTKDAQAMLDNRLTQELFIFSDDAKLLLHETLGESLNYPIPGSYFLYHDQLLYVKGSTELRRVALD